MKIIFLLDNSEFVEVAPEKLQIRQLQPGIAALGTEITVPVLKEDKTPDLNDDGTPKMQSGFRPFINYGVNLTVPQPAATVDGREPALAPEAPAPPPAAAEVVPPVKARKRKEAKIADLKTS